MDAVVLQRSDQFQSGAVADVRKPRIPVTAKISLQYLAVFCAVENRSPGFQFPYTIRGFFRM